MRRSSGLPLVTAVQFLEWIHHLPANPGAGPAAGIARGELAMDGGTTPTPWRYPAIGLALRHRSIGGAWGAVHGRGATTAIAVTGAPAVLVGGDLGVEVLRLRESVPAMKLDNAAGAVCTA